jgi:hypothetical protein
MKKNKTSFRDLFMFFLETEFCAPQGVLFLVLTVAGLAAATAAVVVEVG